MVPAFPSSDIRDAMGNANGDKHLEMFAFAVYGLIMFPKALGYVSVKLADFLFQIEKRYINIPRNRMEESMDDSEHSTHWVWWSFVVPLFGIWGAISYSSLMVLSQYGYDQCVPATAGLNRVEASFKGKRQVLDVVVELTNKICNLEMRLRGRDEETKEEQNKEVTKEYTELAEHYIAVEQMVVSRQEVFKEIHREGGSSTFPEVHQAHEEEKEERRVDIFLMAIGSVRIFFRYE
ncbi:hypothetical protein Golob_021798 [Gossypium lobatum]|uniref:Uncharacterized protein n=1 Tax=Gossypium lobatum TaxID=34289 RepID=A0A7J8LEM2_9ROSI|nr:hypothetical protein [Gossypium lobatum]